MRNVKILVIDKSKATCVEVVPDMAMTYLWGRDIRCYAVLVAADNAQCGKLLNFETTNCDEIERVILDAVAEVEKEYAKKKKNKQTCEDFVFTTTPSCFVRPAYCAFGKETQSQCTPSRASECGSRNETCPSSASHPFKGAIL
jgi:hypothetical protein